MFHDSCYTAADGFNVDTSKYRTAGTIKKQRTATNKSQTKCLEKPFAQRKQTADASCSLPCPIADLIFTLDTHPPVATNAAPPHIDQPSCRSSRRCYILHNGTASRASSDSSVHGNLNLPNHIQSVTFPPPIAFRVVAEAKPADIMEVQFSKIELFHHHFQRCRKQSLNCRPEPGGNTA